MEPSPRPWRRNPRYGSVPHCAPILDADGHPIIDHDYVPIEPADIDLIISAVNSLSDTAAHAAKLVEIAVESAQTVARLMAENARLRDLLRGLGAIV